MNILIFSGRFGMGHNAAANAITEKFLNKYPDCKITTIDLLEELYPKSHKALYKGFNLLVSKYHGLYNVLHKASSQIKIDIKPPGNVVYRKINELIKIYSPDLIISTLPLCAKTISDYKIATGSTIKTITCVTDISIHHEWITPKTDIYLVPTPVVKEHLQSKGIDKNNVFVTGIPIKSSFFPKVHDHSSNRKRNILIMGGGLGLLYATDKIIDTLSTHPNVALTVITGKNEKAYKKLKSKYEHINVIGFTNNVSKYMQEADLIITKAGGITLFEAIYCQTPLFVIHPFLDQEINNAKFIDTQGIGKVIWKKNNNVLGELKNFLMDEAHLEAVKKNMLYAKEYIIKNELTDVIDVLVEGQAS